MKATEIIRNVLDLIDKIDGSSEQALEFISADSENFGDDPNRFKQIVDLLTTDYANMYSNSPNEVVASIDSVTTNAGGGWMGPKNPADLRADSLPLYPYYQHRPGA